MQTGSSETLRCWKSGKTTYVSLWGRMEGAWLWTQGPYSIGSLMEGYNWFCLDSSEINHCLFLFSSVLAKASLNRTLTEYTECQASFPVVGIESPNTLTCKGVLLLPPLGPRGRQTRLERGSGGTQFRRRLTYMAGQDLTDFQG
jgi:hypothetical protein